MAIERRKDNKKRVLKSGEYQRSNGTFEFRWRDKKGKRHSIYEKTLEKLREKETEILRDVMDGIKTDSKNMCINDLYYRWVQLKRGLKKNTFSNYLYMYTQFVEKDFGLSKLDDLKKSDVRAFYNFLTDKQNLKPSTVDNIHTVLHQVLELGVEDEYLRYNPSDNALKELKKAYNKDIEKKKALTIQEQEVFEQFLINNEKYRKWSSIFIAMLYTGLRVGEITGLRWCDVNFEEDFIDINHTLIYLCMKTDTTDTNKTYFIINTPKTKAGERLVPILPKVKKAFLTEKEFQEEKKLFSKSVIDGYSNFVFINRFGNVQHQGTLNKALRRIIRDCNYEQIENNGITLPIFSCHILRHTFTTRMCEAGVNIKAMQDILGHADAETTMNIYADATKDLKKLEMKNFDNFFNELKSEQNESLLN